MCAGVCGESSYQVNLLAAISTSITLIKELYRIDEGPYGHKKHLNLYTQINLYRADTLIIYIALGERIECPRLVGYLSVIIFMV